MTENFRVKIDRTTGSVEVEEPEPFVREMLDKYAGLIQKPPDPESSTPSAIKEQTKKTTKKTTKKPTAGKSGAAKKPTLGSTPAMDDELAKDLRQNLAELKAAFASRRKLNHQEEAAVIAWFLGEKLERKVLDASAYFTTLRVLNRDVPSVTQQVLTDAKNKRNFFDAVDGGFALAAPGINFAERESLKSEQTEPKTTK